MKNFPCLLYTLLVCFTFGSAINEGWVNIMQAVAAKRPAKTGGKCHFAELAKNQSTFSFTDFLLRLSPSSLRYGLCPTVEELNIEGEDGATGRIYEGARTKEGKWPWMAYLYEIPNCLGICGGTLVNSGWVLTAAHCIQTPLPSLYGIILGEYDVEEQSENEMHRLLRTIVTHPNYDRHTFNNDVALLELAKSVHFTEHVRPACLPPSGFSIDTMEEPTLVWEENCFAMGWGQTESENWKPSRILRDAQFSVIPNFICVDQSLRWGENTRQVYSTQSKFCGWGSGSADTCKGDSGGPMVCAINELFFVVGVTSYGPDPCGQIGQFAVFAKVTDPQISDWITKIIYPSFYSLF